MSFGFGVGDFVSVGTLAFQIYLACKEGPEDFQSLQGDVLSLYLIIKEGEERLFDPPLPSTSQQSLKIAFDSCKCLLQTLQSLLKKYEALRERDILWRWKLRSENLTRLRTEMQLKVLTLQSLISISQTFVERKLLGLLADYRSGQRDGSVVSTASVSSSDFTTWRQLGKDLKDVGISHKAFAANKEFILDLLKTAQERGQLEELDSIPESPPTSERYVHPENAVYDTSFATSQYWKHSNVVSTAEGDGLVWTSILSDRRFPSASNETLGSIRGLAPSTAFSPTSQAQWQNRLKASLRADDFEARDLDRIKTCFYKIDNRDEIDPSLLDKMVQTAMYRNDYELLRELADWPQLSTDVRDQNERTLLILAAMGAREQIKLEMLRSLLGRNDINVNAMDQKGHTALVHATLISSESSCLEAVLALLLHPEVDVNAHVHGRGSSKYAVLPCLLSFADEKPGMTEIVRALVNHRNIDLDARNPKGYDVFHLVASRIASNSWLEVFDFLLNHPKVNVNSLSPDGCTVLMDAVKGSPMVYSSEKLGLILKNPRVNPDVRMRNGYTALMLAIKHVRNGGPLQAVKDLVNHPSIDVNIQTKDGNSALHLAMDTENDDIRVSLVETLLSNIRADPNLPGCNGEHPLISLLKQPCYPNEVTLVKDFWLHPKFDVNFVDGHNTPLLVSIIREGVTFEALELIKTLLKHPDLKVHGHNREALPILFQLVENLDLLPNTEAFRFLLNHPDVDVNLRDERGMTALGVVAGATSEKAVEVLDALLQHTEIDVNKRGGVLQTLPLTAAARHGTLESLKLLSAHKDIDQVAAFRELTDMLLILAPSGKKGLQTKNGVGANIRRGLRRLRSVGIGHELDDSWTASEV